MDLLVVFLLRLCLGMAVGMAIVSHRQVSSGYYRNHLYVVLGLATLAALLCPSVTPASLGYAIAAAVLSYIGATCWLYEKHAAGKLALWSIAGVSLVGLLLAARHNLATETQNPSTPDASPTQTLSATRTSETAQPLRQAVTHHQIHSVSSALLIGTTMAAMLLGHWYLNAPGMQLEPLRRLLIAMSIALAIHAIASLVGLRMEHNLRESLPTSWWMFVALRWTCLLGIVALIYMTWQTLKIPNTQSATGILYVAVIGVFTGEIASLVLSAESTYPI